MIHYRDVLDQRPFLTFDQLPAASKCRAMQEIIDSWRLAFDRKLALRRKHALGNIHWAVNDVYGMSALRRDAAMWRKCKTDPVYLVKHIMANHCHFLADGNYVVYMTTPPQNNA